MQQKRTAKGKGIRQNARTLDGLVGILLIFIAGGALGIPRLDNASRLLSAVLVIAGYLGTCSVVRAYDREKGLGVKTVLHEWWQHLRYIWPSLLCMVAVIATLCAALATPLLASMKPDVLPTLVFFSNWAALLHNAIPASSSSPLAHTWFVSIEVQLFLIWVLLLALMLRAGKVVARRITFALALLGAACLVLQCVLGGNLARVSLATDTHACAFLFGAWLGFAFPLGRVPSVGKDLLIKPMGKRNRHMRGRRYQATTAANACGIISLVCILALVVFMPTGGTLTYGIMTILISLLTVLLAATLIAPGNLLGRALSAPPLRYLGSRALGLYLWFTPLYQLITQRLGSTAWYVMAIVAVATVATAEVSYRLVELPFASPAIVGGAQRNTAPYRMVTTALLIVAVGVFGAQALLRLPAAQSTTVEASESASTSDATATGTGSATNSSSEDSSSSSSAKRGTSETDEKGESTNEKDSAEDEDESSNKLEIDDDTIIRAPARETRNGIYDPVLVGDSVPGDADWSRLPDALIDSYIGRRPDQALEVVRGYLDQEAVGKVVILACFSNVTPTPDQLDEFVELLGDERQIYVVGTVNPDGFMEAANANLQDACERHENMHYIDWPAVEEGHQDEYLWADATHLRPEGGVAYVNMVVDAIAQDLIDAGGTTE